MKAAVVLAAAFAAAFWAASAIRSPVPLSAGLCLWGAVATAVVMPAVWRWTGGES